MSPSAFSAALASWHDFYLAVASASAALLGLLFVGVSINLAAITATERLDLRTRADLAFSNLLYLLGVSLVTLIPDVEPDTLAISFATIAILGLARTARRVRGLLRSDSGPRRRRDTARRVAWTIVADILLLAIAAGLGATADARWMLAATVVVLLLVLGAADVAWDLMVREPAASHDERTGSTKRESAARHERGRAS